MSTWISVFEQEVPAVGARPVHLLKREFDLGEIPASATLEITAHGIYTAYINGRRVGTDELTPGYTEYRVHTQVQSYPVGDLLQAGPNALVVELADGWYRGAVGLMQRGNQYGTTVELWAELRADASDELLVETDANWMSRPSHILSADLFLGQNEDLRLRKESAYLAGDDGEPWRGVIEVGYAGQLLPQAVEPNRVVEYLKPVGIRRLGPTTQVIDFGQNSNGWVRLGKLGPAGTQITLTHGEWIDANGDVTLDNLHVNFPIFPEPVWCHQIDTVVSDGRPGSIFEPRYTTHGFQFVRVEGLAEDLTEADISSAVVHTDLRRIGNFRSSDDRLNWLHDAAVWSFRGNALDIPTDCPTRERSGWTGDWQLYVETAAFLYDVREFNRKFMKDVRLNQAESGKVMNIAPSERGSLEGFAGNANGSSGWGDAVVQAPLIMWREYGEESALAEGYTSMIAWIDFAAGLAAGGRHPSRDAVAKMPHEDYLWDTGFHWGEWLEPGQGADNPDFDFFAYMGEDKGVVATAYLHRSARDAAGIARTLGRPEAEVERLEALSENAKKAWQEAYLNTDGTLTVPSQANYARSLNFGMFPNEAVEVAAAELNRLVVESGYHLTTGFLTTPLLLPTLADHGYLDTAYRLLFQDQEPSWLAMRNRGATTIWEQWNGVDANGKPHDSLNHYSKGAVINFLHQYLVGLKPLAPGYARFEVKPRPTPEVEWAQLTLETPIGLIGIEHRSSDGGFLLELVVPAGAESVVTMPDGTTHVLAVGSHTLSCSL